MTEPTPGSSPSLEAVQARLREVARLLRESPSIDPQSQQVLAELVQELSTSLQSGSIPTDEAARLAESTAHLAESLHHQQELGVLGRARERLEEAVVQAEARAPFAAGLTRRVLDVLANLGI